MKKTLFISIFVLAFLMIGPLEELEAIIGRPFTPLSVAGMTRRVARRTARRTSRRMAYAAAATAPTTVVVVTPTPSPSTVTLPIGTAVAALPSGCASTQVGGLTYYQCGGAYYQPVYSGPNLVYKVVMPPQ